jgi:hypothetical protein
MDFYKKTLVLQKTDGALTKDTNGIVKLEREDGLTTLSLSLINFPFDECGYTFFLQLENNSPLCFELDKKPTGLLKVLYSIVPFSEFSCGIFSQSLSPSLLAFAKTEKGADKESLIGLAKQSLIKTPNVEYDDEAVATEDYFSIEKEIKEKVSLIDGVIDDNSKNEPTKNNTQSQENEKNGQSRDDYSQYEKSVNSFQENKGGDWFYQSAKAELDQLFAKFPKENSLDCVLPDSVFCKINYDSNKYYVVGLVKEKGKPKYVCYGVPADSPNNPPKEIEDYCCFLPISLFDLNGKGFWMMFQSTEDGKCVKK